MEKGSDIHKELLLDFEPLKVLLTVCIVGYAITGDVAFLVRAPVALIAFYIIKEVWNMIPK